MYLFIGIIVVLIGATLGLKWFQYLPNNRIKKLASIIVSLAAFNLIFLS
jgi:uncharacterized membrane protein YfcA